MKKYTAILEEEEVVVYLKKRGLLKQYQIAKRKLLLGFQGGLDFKERQPTGSSVYAFRINKQFRAICYERGVHLVVVAVDNHQ